MPFTPPPKFIQKSYRKRKSYDITAGMNNSTASKRRGVILQYTVLKIYIFYQEFQNKVFAYDVPRETENEIIFKNLLYTGGGS